MQSLYALHDGLRMLVDELWYFLYLDVMFLYVLYLKWQLLPFEMYDVWALPFAWRRRRNF